LKYFSRFPADVKGKEDGHTGAHQPYQSGLIILLSLFNFKIATFWITGRSRQTWRSTQGYDL